jgi:xanthine dehydrogenase accessory factor
VRNEAVYDAIQRLRESGQPGVLATVVGIRGSSPGALGAKMLITPDGEAVGTVGGGCVDGMVYAEIEQVLRTERPKTVVADLTENDDPEHGLICGGRVEVFLEPIVTTHLVICGSGHIAHALARLAEPLDFQVTVLDDRELFLNEERFPNARRLVGEFEQILAEFQAPANSFVAVVTRGHRHDQECLEWALGQQARYIGLVGSRAKIQAILRQAAAKGYPEEELAKIRSPIGLDIGAVTVEEIAIAVAAELVAVRRRGLEASRELKNPGRLDERAARQARLGPATDLTRGGARDRTERASTPSTSG